jgi:tetratricopeptide (TPR) repeat protein
MTQAGAHASQLVGGDAGAHAAATDHDAALCLAALDRLGEARTALGLLLDKPELKSDVQGWIMMGNLAARMNDVGRLRTAVARVLALAPDRPEGYALKSMLMRQLKRPADALSAINTAISIHGQDPDLWVMRGLIQGEMGQQAEARASLLTAQFYAPSVIVMIDLDENRLAVAKRFGATDTVNSAQGDAAQQVMKLTGGRGVDTAIEAVGIPATFTLCEDIVAPGGIIANVGVHGCKVDLHLERLWLHNVTITTRLVDTV